LAGYYLGYVYDSVRNGSDLVILDASDFAGDPVATIKLPHRVRSASTALDQPVGRGCSTRGRNHLGDGRALVEQPIDHGARWLSTERAWRRAHSGEEKSELLIDDTYVPDTSGHHREP